MTNESTTQSPGFALPRRPPPTGEDRWMNDATRELAVAIATLRDADEALRFLRDLCTVNELREFAARWEVARLLDAGTSYHEISDRTGASSATISRVNQWLRYGRDGYRLVLDRPGAHEATAPMTAVDALRLAVPNKGRLEAPAVELLRGAGLEFELSERRLSAGVRNADVELLFVRTEDVAEYVADGLVELGLTGADLVAERGGALHTILPLGFGACSLVLAVPRDAAADIGRRSRRLPHRDLVPARDRGASWPMPASRPRWSRSAARSRSRRSSAWPTRSSTSWRRAARCASTGCGRSPRSSPRRRCWWRGTGPPRRDERVSRPLVDMLRSVLDARGREYMMMNAPAEALDRIRALIPGLSGPTVMPLADPAFIAVHSVVERSQLWRIVPALKAAGARDILVVPIEKVVR